ncbi:MAG: right-handed parallel beta-helix repeat-containing protein [Bacteroidetes bacterium]|nr:right-handed parallel beta-helix repeat-containing protein [Bacteroidota bacterium]
MKKLLPSRLHITLVLLFWGTGILVSCSGTDPVGSFDSNKNGEPVQLNFEQTIYLETILPQGFKTDGQVSYIKEIEKAIELASSNAQTLVFPPSVFLIDKPEGIRLQSNIRLDLSSVKFIVDPQIDQDGQIFYGENLRNVEIINGEFDGNRDQLPVSVNIAGIHITGLSKNIKIEGSYFHHLSSNGIRIYGIDTQAMSEDILINNVRINESCNEYIDYLLPNKGPAPGTSMKDQGNIALYFVRNFHILNSVLENSHSDGTHFFYCSNGQISNNQILNNKMGGYFIETCSDINGLNNKIIGNGSRGVTIERSSVRCNMKGNTITTSGREGLWLDDSEQLVISNNYIANNGKKNDFWYDSNIKITDTSWPDNKNESKSKYIYIVNNTFVTGVTNEHAVWVNSCATNISITGNVMLGAKKRIKADSWTSGSGSCVEFDNENWFTSRSGVQQVTLINQEFGFDIKHNLDIYDWDVTDFVFFRFTKINTKILISDSELEKNMLVSVNRNRIRVHLLKIPQSKVGKKITVEWWAENKYDN